METDQQLVRWMLFLTVGTRDGLEALARQDPAMKKALTTLDLLSQDNEVRRWYSEREHALRECHTHLAEAKAEGRKEAARATAIRLLGLGLDLTTIAEATALTVEEVRQLSLP